VHQSLSIATFAFLLHPNDYRRCLQLTLKLPAVFSHVDINQFYVFTSFHIISHNDDDATFYPAYKSQRLNDRDFLVRNLYQNGATKPVAAFTQFYVFTSFHIILQECIMPCAHAILFILFIFITLGMYLGCVCQLK